MKHKLIFLTSLFIFALLIVPSGAVFADYGLQNTADAAGLTNAAGGTDIPTILGNIIGTALSLVSILFFILMIYGGFLWMTAHGKSEQTTKALDTIIAAVIGIVIVMGAYALTNFVFNNVVGGGGTTNTPTPVQSPDNLPAGVPAQLACNNTDECVARLGAGQECRNNQCVNCVANPELCPAAAPVPNIGVACVDNSTCLGGTTCVAGTCQL
ncbi:MAG: hypothetical protein COV59_04565 [Candidatus Magasanikbacteria bacterium CG11_big_fil_rev_8_21_14_0_20_39_34]|uniref:Uncharacterized protein n=1 Tax=Candidatus Magasanikbacteria bacterium CG11_big_fil_rev_8_21_14_0_20_39_34 TaxID=1974653 RepID=A0A2H0N6I8_9BACT|nr:MAG: hypothetical protein COV59_04565 [Candidatus Magasanikbacteria bacterium CG11_big_fil_rev_8_21_14_0_20_39_34]